MRLNISKELVDYPFHTDIAVRVTDLAGGIHVGNQVLVGYLSEAQMQMMKALGFPSLMVDGAMPMNSDLQISFLRECKYGDVLDVGVVIESFTEDDYTLLFNFHNDRTQKSVCQARMRMVFFEPSCGRVKIPEAFVTAYNNFAEIDHV